MAAPTFVLLQQTCISLASTAYYSFKGTFPTAVLTIAAIHQEHTIQPGSLDPIMLLYLSMCIQVQSSCRGSKCSKNSHLGFSTSAPLMSVQAVRWVTYITCISERQPTDTCACSGGGYVADRGTVRTVH